MQQRSSTRYDENLGSSGICPWRSRTAGLLLGLIVLPALVIGEQSAGSAVFRRDQRSVHVMKEKYWGGSYEFFRVRADQDASEILRYSLVAIEVVPEDVSISLDGCAAGRAKDFDGDPDFMQVAAGARILEMKGTHYKTLRVTLHARPGRLYRLRTSLDKGDPHDLQIVEFGGSDALKNGGRDTLTRRTEYRAWSGMPVVACQKPYAGFLVIPPRDTAPIASRPANRNDASADRASARPIRSEPATLASTTPTAGSTGWSSSVGKGTGVADAETASKAETLLPMQVSPPTTGHSADHEPQSTSASHSFVSQSPEPSLPAVIAARRPDEASSHTALQDSVETPSGRAAKSTNDNVRVPPTLPGASAPHDVFHERGGVVPSGTAEADPSRGLRLSSPPQFTFQIVPADSGVFLDGRYLGSQEVLEHQGPVEVKSGRHSIKVIRPGYKIWTDTFVVVDGEMRTIAVTLEPISEEEGPEAP